MALALAATAVPAQAAPAQAARAQAGTAQAGTTLAVRAATTTSPAAAGANWSRLMRRKLDLSAESARLNTLLPSLRIAAVARNADLAGAQAAQTAAAATLAMATAANADAHAGYMTARVPFDAAKKALGVERKRRPSSRKRLAAAQKALAQATTVLQARAVTTGQAATALKTAKTASAAAAGQVAAVTVAYQAATQTLSDTQLKVTAAPATVSALAAQAAGLGPQVVTQTRAGFTVAETTKVYGVTVNKIVAYPFQRLIDDAAKAGVQLSGGGFRTQKQQMALRVTNGCPDVWTAPASSCKVPTAIPGRSLHELGLAIDMTSGQKTITSHSSPAYRWLAANAGRYGFTNLPAEPWHWSITGN